MKEDWYWGKLHRGTRIDNGKFVEGEYYYCEEDKCAYIISHGEEAGEYAHKVYPDSVVKYAGYDHCGKRVFMDEEYKRREARKEEINGKKAWVVVREVYNEGFKIQSIMDSDKLSKMAK